jgi:hypothetical protein
MRTPCFQLSIFDFVGINDTHQIDPRLTLLEQGRDTNLQYLPTKTLKVGHQGVEIDEGMKNIWQQLFHKPTKE